VLFSNNDLADYINDRFEPAWESVHPVPIVRIDFGNEKVLTRTLNGNIATYVCAADGQVFDVLPGIYEPLQYHKSLEQLRLLAQYVHQDKKSDRAAKLQDYHRRQFEALSKEDASLVVVNTAGVSKSGMERPVLALMSRDEARKVGFGDGASWLIRPFTPNDRALWKSLADDTALNETVRRRLVHEHLADRGRVEPKGVVKHIYKDVLYTDLDDPYLGLGKTLFADYPFAKEDAGY
jgi:hypothetical protein